MELSKMESSISLHENLEVNSKNAAAVALEIKALRKDIDQIDETIGLSLAQRHFLSQKVQLLKNKIGQNSFSPEREAQIVTRLKLLFPMIPQNSVEKIYTEIFNWMRPKP